MEDAVKQEQPQPVDPEVAKRDQAYLDAIAYAAMHNELAVMRGVDAKTKEPVSVLVAVVEGKTGASIHLLARLFDADPYDAILPPDGAICTTHKEVESLEKAGESPVQ